MARETGKKKVQPQPALAPAEQSALDKFVDQAAPVLSRLPQIGVEVQELLGRWEAFEQDRPGLLGGTLIAVLNASVIERQLELLARRISTRGSEPSEIAEHADFFSSLLSEYGTLLKVLAEVELDSGSRLALDWEKLSDKLLQAAAELEEQAEQLEIDLEAATGPGDTSGAQAGLHTADPGLLRETWKKMQRGEKLTGEMARLSRIMEAHPEYRELWESGGERDVTIDGVNPYLHATMHVAIERQLEENDPPEVREALDRLVASGMSRHDALHRLGNVLMEHVHRMQRERRNFDHEAYVKALLTVK